MIQRAIALATLLAAMPLALPGQSIRNLTQGSTVRKLWKPIVADAANVQVLHVIFER